MHAYIARTPYSRWLIVLVLALIFAAGISGQPDVLAQGGGCDDPGCGGGIELPPIVVPDPGDDGGDGGSNDDGDDDDGGGSDTETPPPPEACVPGTHVEQGSLTNWNGDCFVTWYQVDNCTGEVIMAGYWAVECPVPDEEDDDFVCDEGWSLGDDGFTCERLIDGLRLEVFVPWPEIIFDVRPYPATMINWPTSVRLSELSQGSRSDTADYYARGGGSPGNPAEGDWRNVEFRLTLKPSPVSLAEAHLPQVGEMTLPLVGPSGTPTVFQWSLPSHPDAGGVSAPAAEVGLPSDFPAFAGEGRAPYELHWSLGWEEWHEWEECVEREDGDEDGDGRENECLRREDRAEWRGHGTGGVIAPTEIPDLPSRYAADLDNDGSPDALWDYNVTMRRMDEAGNPTGFARNWGGALYWWVREGQGQIGAP